MREFTSLLNSARQHSVAIYRSLYFPPAIICLAIIAATLFGWQAAKQSLAHDVHSAAESRVVTAEQSIQTHIALYEQILRGGVGLFQGSDDVTRQDWENYLGAYRTRSQYGGVQGIGYAQVVHNDGVAGLQARMADQGVPDFTITPAGERDTYAPVVYLHAVAATSPPVFGYDMYADPIRRAAMARARDTNRTAITGRIRLINKSQGQHPVGFNMYAPYYGVTEPTSVSDRRDQIRGFVYASFRSDVFFREVVNELDSKAIGFRVTVKGDTSAFYTSPDFDKISSKPSEQFSRIDHNIAVHGQTWHICYVLDHSHIVSSVQLKRPGGVLFFGAFSAFLVSLVVYLVLRGRARDLTVQQERAVEVAKDELLSLASHQLRTPATGVKQYVGMVLQGFVGDISAEQKILLEKAYASNDRQLRIINEILHLAKIDSGRIVLARQQTNLGDLVNDIVSEQRTDITAAHHKLKLVLPKHPIVVSADAHMLRMAIENLLSNAIKYTHPGGKLAVRVRKDRFHAYVTVEDNGIGIENADIPKIFGQFSRLPNEMSQRVEGTGIGLYLAKHLVELHQGTIQVASAVGKGSSFTIQLPLRVKGL